MYRVWCKNKQEWEKDCVLLSPDGSLYEHSSMRRLQPHTHIIQISSKMKDSTNREIYEGDLLLAEGLSMPIEVWYDDGSWVAGIQEGEDRCDDYLWRTLAQFKNCRIVGNIFEGVIDNVM